MRLTKKLRPEDSKVRVVTADESDQDGLHLGAITDGEKNEVPILRKYVDEASLEQIVRTLILHFVALTSGYSPSGNNFENALATELANFYHPETQSDDVLIGLEHQPTANSIPRVVTFALKVKLGQQGCGSRHQ